MKSLFAKIEAINDWYIDEFVHWVFHHFMLYIVFPAVFIGTPIMILYAIYQALTK